MKQERFRKYGGKGAGHQIMMETFATTAEVLLLLSVSALPRRVFMRSAAAQKIYWYLRSRGYVVTRREEEAASSVRLTLRGRRRAMEARRKYLALPLARPAQWDKTWRIIFFDIPAHERRKRNAFRALVKRLGAVMLQKSVWVYPFDCERQVDDLRTYFDLSVEQLRLVLSDDIGEDTRFRAYFNLK